MAKWANLSDSVTALEDVCLDDSLVQLAGLSLQPPLSAGGRVDRDDNELEDDDFFDDDDDDDFIEGDADDDDDFFDDDDDDDTDDLLDD